MCVCVCVCVSYLLNSISHFTVDGEHVGIQTCLCYKHKTQSRVHTPHTHTQTQTRTHSQTDTDTDTQTQTHKHRHAQIYLNEAVGSAALARHVQVHCLPRRVLQNSTAEERQRREKREKREKEESERARARARSSERVGGDRIGRQAVRVA